MKEASWASRNIGTIAELGSVDQKYATALGIAAAERCRQ
jgi:chromosome segregation ATPase